MFDEWPFVFTFGAPLTLFACLNPPWPQSSMSDSFEEESRRPIKRCDRLGWSICQKKPPSSQSFCAYFVDFPSLIQLEHFKAICKKSLALYKKIQKFQLKVSFLLPFSGLGRRLDLQKREDSRPTGGLSK